MTTTHTTTPTGTTQSKIAKASLRFFMAAHVSVYRLSGGKIGGTFRKGPVLLLTTTGRKSGKARTTPLIYLADSENLALVASAGGSATSPAWWVNLKHTPEARVQVGRRVMTMRATQADPQTKARLWPLLAAVYPGYDDYQRKTTREIPVVVLSPV